MEGASSQDVAIALLTHQTRFSPLRLLITDARTAFSEKLINFWTASGQRIFDDLLFHKLPTDAQQNIPIESAIQEIKRMVRTSLSVKRDSKFPTLTISYLSYLFDMICLEFNLYHILMRQMTTLI